MAEPGAITGWLDGLRAGDPAAAQRLWEEYFRRLVGVARARPGPRTSPSARSTASAAGPRPAASPGWPTATTSGRSS